MPVSTDPESSLIRVRALGAAGLEETESNS
jgi:hypothetical protein